MDYTIIFDAFLLLIAAIITRYVVPYIKSKTSAEEQSSISTWVNVAVSAAEQLFDSDMGTEKLAYVQEFLEKMGITVTTEEIEASVYWLHSAVTEGLAVVEEVASGDS